MRRVGIVIVAVSLLISAAPAQGASVDPPWSSSSTISAMSAVRPIPVMATADNGTAITVWSQVSSAGTATNYTPQTSMFNGVGWSAPQNLDNPVKQTSAANPPSPLPDVAISYDGSTAMAMWLQGTAPPFSVRASSATCTTSSTPSCTWSSAVTLADAAAIGVQPQVSIAGDGSSATLTWVAVGSAGAYSTNGYVYSSLWTAPTSTSPATWSAAANLSNDGATQPGVAMSLHANAQSASAKATGTLVTWTAANASMHQNQIEFRTRAARGGLWSGIDTIIGVPNAVDLEAVQPEISDDGSSAVVGFEQDGLLEGSAWASIVNDTSFPWSRSSFDPHQLSTQNAGYPSVSMSRSGNTVVAAWGQEVNNDFLLVSQAWSDGGPNGSWSAMTKVTTNADPDSAIPQVELDASSSSGGVSFCMQANGVGYAPWSASSGFKAIEQLNGTGCYTQLGEASNGTAIVSYSSPGSGATGTIVGAVATSASWPEISLSPSIGVWTGGTTTTLDTSTFPGQLRSVLFDGTAGTIAGTTPGGIATLTVPKHDVSAGTSPTGTVDVQVLTTLGSHVYKNAFTYVNPPVLTSASPTIAEASVPMLVGLTGTGLAGVTAASFSGTSETIASASDTFVRVSTAPALGVGLYNISVSGPGYGNSNTLQNALRLISPPALTSVSPATGESGSSVVIRGSNLTYTTAVTFAGSAATNLNVIDDSTVTANVPAHDPGIVDVAVTTPAGSATLSNAYQYVSPTTAPVVAYVAPSTGPTGTTVTISGDHFTGASAVKFGANAATSFTVSSDESITAVVPTGSGSVDVTVTVASVDGTLAHGFTYATPSVTSVSPTVGSTQGGSEITLTVANLTGVSAITVGGNPVTEFAQISNSTITALTPAGTAGPANIVITAAAGTYSLNGAFTYIAPPTIESLSANTGPTSGNARVTISGSGLSGATQVSFGGKDATDVNVIGDSTLNVTTPQHDAGSVDVSVTNAVGATESQGAYTFVAAPVIDSISPASGPTDGGTSITITGRNLSGAQVSVAGATAEVTTDGAAAMMVLAPPAGPGAADLTVTTIGGSRTAANGYTYVTPAPAPAPTPPAPLPPTPIPVATVIVVKATSPKHGAVKAKISVAPAFGRTGTLQTFVKKHHKWHWVKLGRVVDFGNRARASTTVRFTAKKGNRTFRVRLPMTARGNAATQEFSVKVK